MTTFEKGRNSNFFIACAKLSARPSGNKLTVFESSCHLFTTCINTKR